MITVGQPGVPPLSQLSIRFFVNFLPDYDLDNKENNKVPLHYDDKKALHDMLKSCLESILIQWPANSIQESNVYSGAAGVALFILRLALVESNPTRKFELLEKAKEYVGRSLRLLDQTEASKRDISFIHGESGVLAVAALSEHLRGDAGTRDSLIRRIKDMMPRVQSSPSEAEHVFYGRCGYFYTVLFLHHNIGPDCISLEPIVALGEGVFSRGRLSGGSHEILDGQINAPSLLMFKLYNLPYFGASRGVAGVLYTMLHVPSAIATHTNVIKCTIDYIIAKRLPTGNYPCVDGEEASDIMQWCHGATGVGFLLLKAFEVFKDPKYFEAAMLVGEVVWDRGLLKKGPGLCHGLAGSGYYHLALYRATHDPKYLHRATQLALFAGTQTFQTESRTPDAPWSLFEGWAGFGCFLLDLLYHPEAPLGFPGFELVKECPLVFGGYKLVKPPI